MKLYVSLILLILFSSAQCTEPWTQISVFYFYARCALVPSKFGQQFQRYFNFLLATFHEYWLQVLNFKNKIKMFITFVSNVLETKFFASLMRN